jgi:hypothetical protein
MGKNKINSWTLLKVAYRRRSEECNVPLTLISVLIFIVLFFPGFVYERRRERDLPERTRSPLREIQSILFVGAVAELASFLILSVAVQILPQNAQVNIRDLILGSAAYIADQFAVIGASGIVLVTLASILAYLAAAQPWRGRLGIFNQNLAHRNRRVEPQQSAWWLLLYEEHRDMLKFVECHLDDGSYIAGILHTLSRASDETADRDLSLRNDSGVPLRYRGKGAEELYELANVGAVVISARRIIFLTISYLPGEVRRL